MEYNSIEEIQAEIEKQMIHIKEPIFTSKIPPDPDCYLNAYLDVEWDVYTEGYIRGADIIVKYVIDNDRDQCFLVYPVVFLYRQYLELRLKELISISSRLLGRLLYKNIKIPKNHDLISLWEIARRNIEKIWSESKTSSHLSEIENGLEKICSIDISSYSQTSSHFNEIGNRMKEICRIDQSSCAFRYPEDKKGTSNLKGMKYINLKQVRDVVNGISYVLDRISQIIRDDLNA